MTTKDITVWIGVGTDGGYTVNRHWGRQDDSKNAYDAIRDRGLGARAYKATITVEVPEKPEICECCGHATLFHPARKDGEG